MYYYATYQSSNNSNGLSDAPMAGMTSWYRLELLLFASAIAFTRFIFRSHDLYDLDSVNFALGIEHFDPRVHQPHPPGYFLYICLARLLNRLVHDANLTLVVLSIAASCGVVVLIYQTASNWFGRRAARFAAGLFLFSPLAWFHGTVALTYSVEAFFSALLGYVCWRIVCGDSAWIAPTGFILGVSAGVRPSSLLFLGPLFLFSLRASSPRQRLVGVAALFVTLAAWFFPMISASGGFGAYFGALFSLWKSVPAKETVFNSSPATSIARSCTIGFIYLLFFGSASLTPLGVMRSSPAADRRIKTFTVVWITPALCFFTFIFLKFVNSGYLLLLSAPACVWLGSWAAKWYGNSSWGKPFKLAVIAVCAAVNVLIFLTSPLYCSFRSVRRSEAQLEAIRRTIPQLGPPDDIFIIGFDSHFLGYRDAGYYLPSYLTLEYPEVKLEEGTRIFAMHGRDTRLLARLPDTPYSTFVLFPLPDDEAAYQRYVQQIEKRLPLRSLRKVRAGDHEFITGPVSVLPALFPGTTSMAEPGVYALLHSGIPHVNSRAHLPAR
jgi:Protein of unknown function (DUF2723)